MDRKANNKELDEQIDRDTAIAGMNYLQGKREGAQEILNLLGRDYTNQDGWISIPMLNWREIRKQYRKV